MKPCSTVSFFRPRVSDGDPAFEAGNCPKVIPLFLPFAVRGLIIFFIFALAGSFAYATSISPEIVNPANGHRFVLLQNNTWTSSEAEAQSLGGYLATIRNQADEDWVFSTFGNYGGKKRLLWIGLNDAPITGDFCWVSAAPVTFTAWAPGEPSNLGTEHYVAIYYPGHSAQNQWNNWRNISTDPIGLPLNGVVEINPAVVVSTLIPLGATWSYVDDGSDQGTAWRGLAFDDTAWSSGPAQLGYGGGDEATMIGFGTNLNNRFITTYFRHAFVLTNLDSFAHVYIRLLRGDGAVVYLNGTEVYRSNMPNGPITFKTLASAAASALDETTGLHTSSTNASLLRLGTNVMAVEVHLSATNRAEMSFDFGLNAMSNTPPAISLCTPADGTIFAAPGNVTIVANAADDVRVATVRFFTNQVTLGLDTNSPYSVVWSNPPLGAFALSAVATDSDGLNTTSAPVQVRVEPGLVLRGSVWKYLDTGVDQGTAWRGLTFDDSAWSAGPAQFGYGIGGEATLISFGTNAANKNITTYFRRRFFLAAPGLFTNILLRVLRDDGAVVFLNGQEVYRNNMPGNTPILFATSASTNATGQDRSGFFPQMLSPSLFAPGTNVLAVEIHLAATNSPDLGFDLELIGLGTPDQPVLTIARSDQQFVLSRLMASGPSVLESTASLGPAPVWAPAGGLLVTNGAYLQTTVPNQANQAYYRLRRQ